MQTHIHSILHRPNLGLLMANLMLLIKMQLKYSGATRVGVIKGFPKCRSQSCFSAVTWVELSPTPAPTVMLIPRACAV